MTEEGRVPILTPPAPEPAVRRILVGVSTLSPSVRFLTIADGLARRFGAEVLVLHVRERLVPGSEWFFGDGPFSEGADEASPALELTMARLRRDGVRARVVTAEARTGRVARAIVAVASAAEADLIVIGSRRRPGARWLGRDVARRVQRRSPLPVLSVPSLPRPVARRR
jgi:nucleotide-binding universal stress UspA family protein